MKKSLQLAVQVIFTVLFAILVVVGRIQLWMGLFLIGVVASLFFSRIYCGWVCPINTLMKGVTYLKGKLSIVSFQLPKAFLHPWIRYTFLALFILVFVFTMITGRKLPVLPALLIIGVGLTLFFPEAFWHRHLCPFGTIFSITSTKARYSMTIDDSICIQCGACQPVCPAEAIKNTSRYEVDKSACIVCSKCRDQCTHKAISYKKT